MFMMSLCGGKTSKAGVSQTVRTPSAPTIHTRLMASPLPSGQRGLPPETESGKTETRYTPSESIQGSRQRRVP